MLVLRMLVLLLLMLLLMPVRFRLLHLRVPSVFYHPPELQITDANAHVGARSCTVRGGGASSARV